MQQLHGGAGLICCRIIASVVGWWCAVCRIALRMGKCRHGGSPTNIPHQTMDYLGRDGAVRLHFFGFTRVVFAGMEAGAGTKICRWRHRVLAGQLCISQADGRGDSRRTGRVVAWHGIGNILPSAPPSTGLPSGKRRQSPGMRHYCRMCCPLALDTPHPGYSQTNCPHPPGRGRRARRLESRLRRRTPPGYNGLPTTRGSPASAGTPHLPGPATAGTPPFPRYYSATTGCGNSYAAATGYPNSTAPTAAVYTYPRPAACTHPCSSPRAPGSSPYPCTGTGTRPRAGAGTCLATA